MKSRHVAGRHYVRWAGQHHVEVARRRQHPNEITTTGGLDEHTVTNEALAEHRNTYRARSNGPDGSPSLVSNDPGPARTMPDENVTDAGQHNRRGCGDLKIRQGAPPGEVTTLTTGMFSAGHSQ